MEEAATVKGVSLPACRVCYLALAVAPPPQSHPLSHLYLPCHLALLSLPSVHPPLQEFNLIDERELAPLKELIDRMVR